ncbi:MAG: hypothetical protein ACK44N_04520 [Bacteroidota bacterium]|jgi:hypothetical protein
MTNQTNSVKALIKDLENGKRQLKAEFDRSMNALDAAIKVLSISKLDPSDFVKGGLDRKPGRPMKGAIDLKMIVRKIKGKGRRGRPVGSRAQFHGNLTQTLYDLVLAQKRFVHNRDIVAMMMKKYPNVDRSEFAKKVSVLLASLKKQERLVTYQDGGYRKNMFWGTREWMKGGKPVKGKEPKK